MSRLHCKIDSVAARTEARASTGNCGLRMSTAFSAASLLQERRLNRNRRN